MEKLIIFQYEQIFIPIGSVSKTSTNAKTRTDIKYVCKKNIKLLPVLNIQKNFVMMINLHMKMIKLGGIDLNIFKQFKVYNLILYDNSIHQ